MQWYGYLSLFGFPTLIALVIADIYARFKMRGKRYLDKRKEDRIVEVQEAIEEPIKKITENISKGFNNLNENQGNIQKRIDLMEEVDICILRTNLLHSYSYCERQGYRSLDDTSTWMSMYEAYQKLGGNSFIHRLKKDFEDLPTESEWEAKKADKLKNKQKKTNK